VIVSEPIGAPGELHEPIALVFKLAEHSSPLLLLKMTEPVGVGKPEPADTVAE
jgi:hypothetical protein